MRFELGVDPRLESVLRASFAEMLLLIPQVAARQILPRFLKVRAEYKIGPDGARETVTEADTAASNDLLKAARCVLPASSSEEDLLDSRFSADAYWLIDPVDGTDEFVAGLHDGYSVSAALIVRCGNEYRPVAGIMYRPSLNEMWYADLDGKAHHTIDTAVVPLSPSKRDSLRGCIRKVDPSARSEAFQLALGAKLGLNAQVKPLGGAAASFCDLLNDRINLALLNFNYSKEWDVAMAVPVIQARGGFICDLDGNDFIWNRRDVYNRRGFIASLVFRKEEIIPFIPTDLVENRLKH